VFIISFAFALKAVGGFMNQHQTAMNILGITTLVVVGAISFLAAILAGIVIVAFIALATTIAGVVIIMASAQQGERSARDLERTR
jgi:hypothetical protein